jgi:hypothetical protein
MMKRKGVVNVAAKPKSSSSSKSASSSSSSSPMNHRPGFLSLDGTQSDDSCTYKHTIILMI